MPRRCLRKLVTQARRDSHQPNEETMDMRSRAKCAPGEGALFESVGAPPGERNSHRWTETDGTPRRFAPWVSPQPPHRAVIGGEAVEVAVGDRIQGHSSDAGLNCGRRIPSRG